MVDGADLPEFAFRICATWAVTNIQEASEGRSAPELQIQFKSSDPDDKCDLGGEPKNVLPAEKAAPLYAVEWGAGWWYRRDPSRLGGAPFTR